MTSPTEADTWIEMGSLDRAHACGRYHLWLVAICWSVLMAALFPLALFHWGAPEAIREFRRAFRDMWRAVTD